MTFPGIIEDPGSFYGSINYPKPLRGPDPKNRISLAILWIDVANEVRDPWKLVNASFEASA